MRTSSEAVLIKCLLELTPVELQGVVLMKAEAPPTGEQLRDAIQDYMAYTKACGQLCAQLENLPPIPLAHPLVEWVL